MLSKLPLYSWWLAFVLAAVVRVRYTRGHRDRKIVHSQFDGIEKVALGLAFVGMQLLPFVYIFSNWLSFADYRVPLWASLTGVVVMFVGIWLIWRSHVDLGNNWSPSVEIGEGQTLVTTGSYRWMRHPMYTGHMLWAVAHIVIFPNWLAGPGFLLSQIFLLIVRLPREEAMMEEEFGDAYRAYKQRTGALFPGL